MRIDLVFQFHPGAEWNPRPSLKITAKALRRTGSGGYAEELTHTRLVDCPYPERVADALQLGLDRLHRLRPGGDAEWWNTDDEDLAQLTGTA